jgi:molybdopterin synthase sulfur carrier subunit
MNFVLPGPLRDYSGGRGAVGIDAGATTLSESLDLLWRECPGVRDRVLTERGEVRQHVNIFVDGKSIRDAGGLSTPVRGDSEILILPALSGG